MLKKSLSIFKILALVCLTVASLSALLALPQNAYAVSNQGLVGYWSFNEGTSTVATDFSGNGNAGTFNDTPTWANGKRGNALSFNVGSADYVDVGSIESIAGVSKLTVSAWIKRDALNSKVTLGWQESDLIDDITIEAWSDGLIYVNLGAIGSFPSNDTEWHHVVLVYDGDQSADADELKAYLDGVQQSLSGLSGVPDVSPTTALSFLIGRVRSDSSTTQTAGRIDEVRVYNRALSPTEVAELYRAGASFNKPPNNLGLVGYWSFDDATSSKATDFSGNGNTGTLESAVPPSWENGKRGKALDFGGDDFVNVTHSASVNITGALTIALWMNKTSLASFDDLVHKGNGAGDRVQYGLETNDDELFFLYCTGTNAACTTSHAIQTTSANFATDTWYHVAVTYSDTGDAIALYVNGVAQSESVIGGTPETSSIISSTNDLIIGRTYSSDDTDGRLDDVRIYNRALGASEVATLYGAGTGASGAVQIGASSQTLQNGTTLGSGLVGLWTFDGYDLTDKVYDRSGSSNNGYFVGGATSSAKVSGKLGQALNFDGASGQVRFNSGSNPLNFQQGTVGVWVRPANATPAANEMLVKASRYNNRIYIMRGTNGNLRLQLGTGAGFDAGTAIPANSWTHVAFVWSSSGTAYTAYVNGVSVSSGSITELSGITEMPSFAAYYEYGDGSNNAFYTGQLDDIRFYNRALTAAEVKQLYNLGQTQLRP